MATLSWPRGKQFHRIHRDVYGATQFNPGTAGNARFSPIHDGARLLIPTLYGGETFECAAMETVFHDVPFAPGLKTFDKAKFMGHTYSVVEAVRDLELVDLSTTALRNLGIRRVDLVDTEKDQYPGTRGWAEAIHAACSGVDGLCWMSRQDDRASAIVLFGDRVASSGLSQVGASRDIVGNTSVYANLLSLAGRIGVQVI